MWFCRCKLTKPVFEFIYTTFTIYIGNRLLVPVDVVVVSTIVIGILFARFHIVDYVSPTVAFFL